MPLSWVTSCASVLMRDFSTAPTTRGQSSSFCFFSGISSKCKQERKLCPVLPAKFISGVHLAFWSWGREGTQLFLRSVLQQEGSSRSTCVVLGGETSLCFFMGRWFHPCLLRSLQQKNHMAASLRGWVEEKQSCCLFVSVFKYIFFITTILTFILFLFCLSPHLPLSMPQQEVPQRSGSRFYPDTPHWVGQPCVFPCGVPPAFEGAWAEAGHPPSVPRLFLVPHAAPEDVIKSKCCDTWGSGEVTASCFELL